MPPDYVSNLRSSGLTIYDPIVPGDAQLWVPDVDLQRTLTEGLRGRSFAGLPLRTRSKAVKTAVCEALGYPAPSTFKKSIPRFPGQDLEVYSQQSGNLQVWNQPLSPDRRYAVIKLSDDGVVETVKIVLGKVLQELDTTGTLTTKFQARFTDVTAKCELVSKSDTAALLPHVSSTPQLRDTTPIDSPRSGGVYTIQSVFERLSQLVGKRFKDSGVVRERTRGGVLHAMVSEVLGYRSHADNGQFPDVLNQLLEVKLQTSPTIDLGCIAPNSEEALKLTPIGNTPVRHCDVRYAVFKAEISGEEVILTNLSLSTGADFFSRFPQFGGKVSNSKIQIPLPRNFYD